MSLDESYAGDSGFFTDYTGTITDAWFEQPENRDDYFIFLKFKTDSPDRPEHEERYSLGRGWITGDGGETVYNDENKRKFNRRFSNYQSAWLDHAVPLLIEAGVAEEFGARGPATQASVWKGTRWDIQEKEERYQPWDKEKKKPQVDPEGKPVYKTLRYNIPVAFLGLEGDSSTNGKVEAVDLSWLDGETLALLRDVAKAAPNREVFLNRMMLDVPNLSQVEGAVGKLATDAAYQTLRAS